MEFKPRIKLNHNINVVRLKFGSFVVFVCLASTWVEFYHHGLICFNLEPFSRLAKSTRDPYTCF